ncbi:hypothetical protein D3C78_1099620 [compost metagenome]
MLNKRQPAIPVVFIHRRVKAHRHGTQVTIKRGHIMLRIHRLQPGIEQFGTDIEIALIEAIEIGGAQEKRQRGPVQFMLVAQVFPGFFGIFTGAGGFNIFPHSVTA